MSVPIQKPISALGRSSLAKLTITKLSCIVTIFFAWNAECPEAAAGSIDLKLDNQSSFSSNSYTPADETDATAPVTATKSKNTSPYFLALIKQPQAVKQTFVFSADLIGAYESNGLSSATDPVGLYSTNPDVGLAWVRETDASKLSVSLSGTIARADRDESAYGDDEYSAGFEYDFKDMAPHLANFQPAVSYLYDATYDDNFDQPQLRYHSFALNFSRKFDLDTSAANSAKKKASITLSAGVEDRFAAPSASDRTILSGGAKYNLSFGDDLGLAIVGNLSESWYRSGTNGGRNDTRVVAKAELTRKLSDQWALSFAVQYSQNYSNMDTFHISGWIIGPKLSWELDHDLK